MHLPRIFRAGVAAALLFTAACSGDGGPGPNPKPQQPQPAALAPVSPTQSASTVASAVEARVRVTDATGAPLSGVTVSFTVLSGGGSVGATTASNGAGEATASWTRRTKSARECS